MVENDFDLLMMESAHEGPAVTIVEAPREMFQDSEGAAALEMESRMASPERSYVDEDQFVVYNPMQYFMTFLYIKLLCSDGSKLSEVPVFCSSPSGAQLSGHFEIKSHEEKVRIKCTISYS